MHILVVGAFLAFGAVILGSGFAYSTMTTDYVVGTTVTHKERIVERSSDGSTSSKYLIFTDIETFENTDSLWHLKFRSSDLYGRIQVGQTCNFKVYGLRIGYLSTYRNIIDADCA
jgi:hypothetical protein